MTLQQQTTIGEMLFGNARIRRVHMDAATATLRISAVYDDREYLTVSYGDLFYTQLNETCAGLDISLAQRIGVEELNDPRHNASKLRLISECGCASVFFLKEIERKGYCFFMHYAGKEEEYLVVARTVSVLPGL